MNFSSELADVGSAIKALALDFNAMSTWEPAPDSATGGAISTNAPIPPSPLYSDLKFIFDGLSNSESFAGTAILPLRRRYNGDLQISTRSICGLLYVYGAHIAAEKEIWHQTAIAIDTILTKAHEGFVAAASGAHSETNWKPLLQGLGLACDGLALLATFSGIGAPGALVIGGVGLGVTAIETYYHEPAEPAQDALYTYDDVIEYMSTAVSEVYAAVLEVEQNINNNVDQNLASIKSNSHFFDLTGAIFDDQDRPDDIGGHQKILWNPIAAADISTSMRNASEYYVVAGSKLANSGIWEAAKRPSGLGTSTTGPAQRLDDFGATLRALLLALGEELKLGATNVDAATGMFTAAEDEHVANIVKLEAEVDLSSIATLQSSTTSLDPLSSTVNSATGEPTIKPLGVHDMMQGWTSR